MIGTITTASSDLLKLIQIQFCVKFRLRLDLTACPEVTRNILRGQILATHLRDFEHPWRSICWNGFELRFVYMILLQVDNSLFLV